MIGTAHEELFKIRKWKPAFSVMPLDTEYVVKVENPGELLTIRTRASEFTRESEDKKVSVSLNFDEKKATIIVTNK